MEFVCPPLSELTLGLPVEVLEQQFRDAKAYGLELSVDLKGADPWRLVDVPYCTRQAEALREHINMIAYQPAVGFWFAEGPVEGVSWYQLIMTSNLGGHNYHPHRIGCINIHSCKWFDPYSAIAFCMEAFGASRFRARLLIRAEVEGEPELDRDTLDRLRAYAMDQLGR